MARIPENVVQEMQERAEGIAYGDIIVHLTEHLSSVDVEYHERVRYEKSQPRPGQAVVRVPHKG
jgi:Ribonuclease G/E